MNFKNAIAIGLTSTFCLLATACSDAPGGKRYLEEHGYKDVVMEGYDAWADWKHPIACDDDDTKTAFSATAPDGKRVHGDVCGGLFTYSIGIDR